MKFEIKNRWSGNVQFTAEIDCAEDASNSLKLGLAVRWAIKNDANLARANLADAYLARANLADAYLAGANLADANLADAYLEGANLAGANLAGANLADAYLEGANLAGANLAGANLIHCGTRSDGYEFFAHIRDGKICIKAGCRYFTLKDAKAQWENTRADTQLGEESLQLLKNAKRLVEIRGLMKETME